MPQKKTIEIDPDKLYTPSPGMALRPPATPEVDQSGMVNLLTDPRSWWANLTDEQKQSALDRLGELAGGTAGGAAGEGLLSIPGAAAGAVAGKNIARLAGKAAGLKQKPETTKEVLADIGETAALNAVGEGAGRFLPSAAKAVGSRIAKRIINPNPETVRLAQEAGAELTPGMMSTGAMPKYVERTLEKLPGGTQDIRNATQKAAAAYEGRVRSIANTLHPTPVSDQEAGEAAVNALTANRQAARDYFEPKYAEISSMVGNEPVIDLGQLRTNAQQLLQSLPQGAESAFPKPTLAKLRQLAGIGNDYEKALDSATQALGGTSFSAVTEPGQRAAIERFVRSQGITPDASKVTFEEAKNLRTQLLEAQRALTSQSAAIDRRAIPSLAEGIDQSIDNSLSQTNADALSKWRDVNSQFKEYRRRLYGPTKPGKPGNPIASKIERADQPEKVLPAATQNATAVQQTRNAVSPESVHAFGAESPTFDSDPMNIIRRNRFDNIIDKSSFDNKYLSNERHVSPLRLSKEADKPGASELLGPPTMQDVEDATKLGRAIYEPLRMENASDTARYNKLIGLGYAAGGAMVPGEGWEDRAKHAAEAAAVGYALPKLAAKAWTSEAFRNALTQPPPSLSPKSGLSGSFYGLLGRASSPVSEPTPPLDVPAQSIQPPTLATATPVAKKQTVEVDLSDLH